MTENIIRVGMADLQVSCHPCMLTTLGLGSCVGIAMYDPVRKVAGMAHIMLPSSKLAISSINHAKFADTAIVMLIEKMIKSGAVQRSIYAKLAGGAQMFCFNDTSETMRIGDRNVNATRELLSQFRIPVISEDTGGNYGRTIELYSDDGRLVIKTVGKGMKQI